METSELEQIAASISFRQLELFAAVGRCGGIEKAAAECGVSQPAATQALGLLQDKVGEALLKRGQTGTALTSSGKLFHETVAAVIDEALATIAYMGAVEPKKIVPRLTPAQMRTLSSVLATGSLEQAALSAGLSRDGIRRSARILEDLVGPLFERAAEGNVLTPRGRDFAERICDLRDRITISLREMRARRDDNRNTLVVGAAQAFGNRLITRVLIELAARHSEACITVLREGPSKLIGRLRVGEVDMVVGDVQEDCPGLIKEQLVPTPYYVFARPGHPLSRLESIAVEDLAACEWVGGTPGSVRERVRNTLFAESDSPRVAFAASEGAMVGHFVAGSDRLALMTEHESRCGGLALSKLPYTPLESGLGIDVVSRADTVPSPLHEELVELLRSHVMPETRRETGKPQWHAA